MSHHMQCTLMVIIIMFCGVWSSAVFGGSQQVVFHGVDLPGAIEDAARRVLHLTNITTLSTYCKNTTTQPVYRFHASHGELHIAVDHLTCLQFVDGDTYHGGLLERLLLHVTEQSPQVETAINITGSFFQYKSVYDVETTSIGTPSSYLIRLDSDAITAEKVIVNGVDIMQLLTIADMIATINGTESPMCNDLLASISYADIFVRSHNGQHCKWVSGIGLNVHDGVRAVEGGVVGVDPWRVLWFTPGAGNVPDEFSEVFPLSEQSIEWMHGHSQRPTPSEQTCDPTLKRHRIDSDSLKTHWYVDDMNIMLSDANADTSHATRTVLERAMTSGMVQANGTTTSDSCTPVHPISSTLYYALSAEPAPPSTYTQRFVYRNAFVFGSIVPFLAARPIEVGPGTVSSTRRRQPCIHSFRIAPDPSLLFGLAEKPAVDMAMVSHFGTASNGVSVAVDSAYRVVVTRCRSGIASVFTSAPLAARRFTTVSVTYDFDLKYDTKYSFTPNPFEDTTTITVTMDGSDVHVWSVFNTQQIYIPLSAHASAILTHYMPRTISSACIRPQNNRIVDERDTQSFYVYDKAYGYVVAYEK